MSTATFPVAHQNATYKPQTIAPAASEAAQDYAQQTSTKGARRFLPVTILMVLLAFISMIGTVSADICWTDITSITDGIGTQLIPSFVSLVTAAVPLLIIMAVIGFIMGFLDKILDMLKLR